MSSQRRFNVQRIAVAVLAIVPALAVGQTAADVQAAYDRAEKLAQTAKRSEAAQELERVVKLAEKVYGPDHASTALFLNDVAVLYARIGEYSQAERLYQRSLRIREEKLGQDHPAVAGSLSNLGALYQSMGQLAKAEPLLERAIRIIEAKQGKDDPAVATALNNLATLYINMGRHAKAEPLLRRSLQITESKLGKDHPRVAIALNNLGQLYNTVGEYDKAEPLYQRSLQIREAKLGPDHPDVAIALNNLANHYVDRAQYAKAEPLLERSLQIKETKLGKDHPDVAVALTNLGQLHQEMGQYDKAESFYQRGLQIRETKLGADHPAVASSLSNLGTLYYLTGLYAKAEPLLQRSLRIREAKLGADHLAVATSLNSLGLTYQAMGQYEKAEPLHQRSLRISETKQAMDLPEVAIWLGNLAALYQSMGQYTKAEPLLLRGLQIKEAKLGKDHPDVAVTLQSLARLFIRQGEHAKAEPLLLRALEIQEAKLGKEHPRLGNTLDSLGGLYRLTGQHAKAKAFYQRALQIREAKLAKDHPDVAVSWNNLGTLAMTTGQYAEAQQLYERSLELRLVRQSEDHPEIAVTRAGLAMALASQSLWAEAAQQWDSLRRSTRRHTARILPALPESEQLTYLHTVDELRLHASLSLGLRRREDSSLVAASANWLLNGKAVAQEALAERALFSRIQDPAVAASARQLLEVRSQLGSLTIAGPKPGQETTHRQLLDRLNQREQDLVRRLVPAGVNANRGDPWVELAAVRKGLSARSVLVEIARFRVVTTKADKLWEPARYAAWIIPPAREATLQLIDLGDAKAIDDAVAAARQVLSQAPAAIRKQGEPDAEKALRQPLDTLAKLALHPLLPHIVDAERWILSPDADLWLVPWAALPLPDGKYAIEKHTIGYVVSGRDVVAAAPALKTGRARIMADPDFDLQPGAARAEVQRLVAGSKPASELRGGVSGTTLPRMERLPGTLGEAQAIKPKLDRYVGEETWIYKDKSALEGIVKTFRSPRVLVLSTHGFFLPDQEVVAKEAAGLENKQPALTREGKPLENPLLRCGLLLAGCNQRDKALQPGDEDGVLTGLEIVGLDLRGTELVVLSACETGLGQVRNGEGVAGLRQAFQLAGARSVVATLWQIPDVETARLMSDLFGNLADKKSKADALREAQLAQIKARRARNGAAHPFFWAAFTLTGQ